MWRPAHGATSRPGPCRPASGYGRALGRPGPRDVPVVRAPSARSSRRGDSLDPRRSAEPRPAVAARPGGEPSYSVISESAVGEAGRTGPGARGLRGHELGEVALDLDLALHERLHPGLRVAAA